MNCARRAINDTCILSPKGQIHHINVKDECYDVQIELRKEQRSISYCELLSKKCRSLYPIRNETN